MSNITVLSKATNEIAAAERILECCRAMAALPDSQKVVVEIMHHFTGNIYARTMYAKAGTIVAGYRHRKECLVIVSMGAITVASAKGVSHFVAPAIFVAEADSQRIGYAQVDTIWTTINDVGELRDIDAIEAELFALEEI